MRALAQHAAGEAQAPPADPRRRRADGPDVVGEVGVLEADRLQVHPPPVRVEAVEGEAQGGEREREVVELAEDRDEARHEVDGADEVAGCRDDRDASGLAQHRVLAQPPAELRVAGRAVDHGGQAVARERVGVRGRLGRDRLHVLGHRPILWARVSTRVS